MKLGSEFVDGIKTVCQFDRTGLYLVTIRRTLTTLLLKQQWYEFGHRKIQKV